MKPIEIIVITACVLIVGGVIISSIINRKKGKNSCGCNCSNCSYRMGCKNKDYSDANK